MNKATGRNLEVKEVVTTVTAIETTPALLESLRDLLEDFLPASYDDVMARAIEWSNKK